jgi:hypothetical protein
MSQHASGLLFEQRKQPRHCLVPQKSQASGINPHA